MPFIRSFNTGRKGSARRKPAALNMVSLMDIFTILVFFLLTNSSDIEVIPATRLVDLPESVSDKKPDETITLIVNRKDILVDGKPVAKTGSIDPDQPLIAELRTALRTHSRENGPNSDDDLLQITILADRSVPYTLLKKVIATCSDVNFRKIALAVSRKTADGGEAS